MSEPASSTVRIEPWGKDDLPLLEKLMGDPEMTEHLGGPESPEKVAERQARYERLAPIYEIGWSVIPAYQGRGIAGMATAQAMARADGKHRFMHAFSSVDNLPSNAISRKLGFTLVEERQFEYPPGSFMRCNDWRLDLFAGS